MTCRRGHARVRPTPATTRSESAAAWQAPRDERAAAGRRLDGQARGATNHRHCRPSGERRERGGGGSEARAPYQNTCAWGPAASVTRGAVGRGQTGPAAPGAWGDSTAVSAGQERGEGRAWRRETAPAQTTHDNSGVGPRCTARTVAAHPSGGERRRETHPRRGSWIGRMGVEGRSGRGAPRATRPPAGTAAIQRAVTAAAPRRVGETPPPDIRGENHRPRSPTVTRRAAKRAACPLPPPAR